MILVDTHVLHWMAFDPQRISQTARTAIEASESVGVAAITWYELALLIERGRLKVDGDKTAALDRLAPLVNTVGLDVAIASAASDLEAHPSFPRDPADRLIFATAQVRGVPLVTADGKLRWFAEHMCVW